MSLLAQEMAQLNLLIAQAREKLAVLEREQCAAEEEFAAFAAEKERFDALREVCDALDHLGDIEAGDLFWDGLTGTEDSDGHVNRLRDRIGRFEEEIRGIQEKRESLKRMIHQQIEVEEDLQEEVRQAYAREERRLEEFVIEREVSPVPYAPTIMPWSKEGEDERRFRKALLVALLLSAFFGYVIPLWNLPKPERSAVVVIPERLAVLVKKEPPPPPEPVRPVEEKKPEPEPEQPAQKKEAVAESKPKPQATPTETRAARKKAESTGVLAFKNTFSDLMEETPVANLGAEARLVKDAPRAAGQARAQRSLVAMQATGGSSGGIGNAGVSRNVGSGNSDKLGGVGFSRVESAVAGATEEARPLSSGPGPARTDEEIQIVFDRYKATLYRIYNTELRRDPTLRGKLVLRLTIEPGGEVSVCKVESTDLGSPELVAQIVERVKRFNFGPKEDVPKTTILYPIDFLPAG